MKNPTIVLGLGNPLMADEGIGIQLIELLQSKYNDYPQVEFVDAGTGGMSVLHYISGRNKAIIIDCALMGTEPGTIKRFTPDEVKTVKKLAHLSLHEADILKVIELSKQLGECPKEIVFFGIEPEIITPRIGLSDTLSSRLEEFFNIVSKELDL